MSFGFFKTRYRIVRDGYAGYEVQSKWWWSPFWFQCGFTNTHSSIDRAIEYIKKRHEVFYID